MRTVLLVYNDDNWSKEQLTNAIKYDFLAKMDFVLIVNHENNVHVWKNRWGHSRVDLAIPDELIEVVKDPTKLGEKI